jgi:hypothetical protein
MPSFEWSPPRPLAMSWKQRRDVEQPGRSKLVIRSGVRAGTRGRMLGDHEAAQIAQHLQDVLIHRVDVEEVVLHLADDAPPGGQVEAQDAVLVHPPQFRARRRVFAADLAQEQGRFAGSAEFGIDELAAAPQGAQGAHGHALQLGALLQQRKHSSRALGVAIEDAFVAYVQELAHALEALVDVDCRGVAVRKELDAKIEQQDGVELGDLLGRAVILLHENFGGAAGSVASKPNLRASFSWWSKSRRSSRRPVRWCRRIRACCRKRSSSRSSVASSLGDQRVPGQVAPVGAKTGCAADPADQSAGHAGRRGFPCSWAPASRACRCGACSAVPVRGTSP